MSANATPTKQDWEAIGRMANYDQLQAIAAAIPYIQERKKVAQSLLKDFDPLKFSILQEYNIKIAATLSII